MLMVFIVLLTLLPVALAYPQYPPPGFGGGMPPGQGFGGRPPFGGPMGGAPPVPPVPREVPAGFEAVLPAETLAQLRTIHESNTLSNEDKHDRIDKLLSSLPDEVLDRLPLNPALDKLPQDVKDKMKTISRDKTLGWRQKMDSINRLMGSLPESVRRLLPPPPPPGFELLPEETKAELKAVHENTSLGFRERYFKIKEIMDKVPADIRSKLPPPPPPPPMQ